jgi:hypothetical protein
MRPAGGPGLPGPSTSPPPAPRQPPHSLHHPQRPHVGKHTCQALGSRVADGVIVQAAGGRGRLGKDMGVPGRGVVRAQRDPDSTGITIPFYRGADQGPES